MLSLQQTGKFLMGIILLISFRLYGQNGIIIDHTSTDLHAVPINRIDSAKAKLNIFYGHTSHGNQLTAGGMAAIMRYSGEYDSIYRFGNTKESNSLFIDEVVTDLSHYEHWVPVVRNYLDSHPECNVAMISWCNIYGQDIDAYLLTMDSLRLEYGTGGSKNRNVPVRFVYMTGHTNTGPANEFTFNANKKIKEYCIENHRILYDFYDIECYNPDGEYYGDGNPDGSYAGERFLDDDLSYNKTSGGRGNWGNEWIAANEESEWSKMAVSSICTKCDHSDGTDSGDDSRLNCILKGNAAWQLWARLAGWQSETEDTILVQSITVTPEDENDTLIFVDDILQMRAEVLPVEAENRNIQWSVTRITGNAEITADGVLTATEAGRVNVVATAMDGSGVWGNIEILIIHQPLSSLDETEKDAEPEIILTQRMLMIRFKENNGYDQFSLFDLKGIKRYHVSVSGNVTLSVTSLPRGIYLLSFTGNQGQLTKKIFIPGY